MNIKQESHRRRRSVTFSETSQMILIPDLSNLSSDCRDKLWCSPDELYASKANILFCKRAVQRSISKRETPSASSILGIEKFLTVQLTIEYVNRRDKLRKSVLDEAQWQEKRRRMCRRSSSSHAAANLIDDDDVDTLAQISSDHSRWARERARAAALFLQQDQEHEAQLHQQTIDACQDFMLQKEQRHQPRRVSQETIDSTFSSSSPSAPMDIEEDTPRFVRDVSPMRN